MKLAYVEVAGFRGFKDSTRFDFPAGFVVLTGRNGVGKSTILDAIDFALTGTINKYAVKGAKGGGLESHIWWVGDGAAQRHYVSVGFTGADGEKVSITRSRERGLVSALEIIRGQLCSGNSFSDSWAETLMQTTLIRDETLAGLSLDLPGQARFSAVRAAIGGLTGPDHSGRTSNLLRAANTAKDEQEGKLAQIQAELGRALSALTEARSIAERQADVAEAEDIITALEPNIAIGPGDRAEQLRRRVAERKQFIPLLMEAIRSAESVQSEERFFFSDAGQSELAYAQTERETARQAMTTAEKVLAAAESQAAAEQETDAFAAHMVALLNHGEAVGLQDGHCPLCDAVRSGKDFGAAIAAARARLNARGERAAEVSAQLEQARVNAAGAAAALAQAELKLAALAARRQRLLAELSSIREVFSRLSPIPSDPATARRLTLQHQEETAQLESALFILEASGAHDRVTALEARTEQLRTKVDEETAKLDATDRAVEAARQIDSAASSVANQVLTEQFETVLPLLKELYQRLRPHTDWREIETDFGGRVRASLNFSVGDGRNPQFLFSSGQRRAAGLAFLLAIHLSRPWCRLRSLLLDDPVQHIDDYRALNLVELLSAVRRSGRQVVVAVEDPALADLLCRRLRSTVTETGRRFELGTANNGSATIEHETDIFPLLRDVLQVAEAS